MATSDVVDWKGTARFEVVRCIGRGGMGTVYEAQDRERAQRVALKTLVHVEPASLYLFKQEFRTLSGVQHRNLVRLYELVADDPDRPFFSMELVRGTDFLAYVQRPGTARLADGPSGVTSREMLATRKHQRSGVHATAADRTNGMRVPSQRPEGSPADFDRLRPALRQLAEGLHALHAHRKLHRDVKPSNILVNTEGRVVLLDFGVSTDIPRVSGDALAEEGQFVGTARYVAPEQAFGEVPTPAADWYSVGIILYEALVGAPPFAGPVVDVVSLKSQLDAPPPSELVVGVPADLEELCVALLSRNPDQRPAGTEILRRVGAVRSLSSAPGQSELASNRAPLIGREGELGALHAAFECTRDGLPVGVFVSGRAGMGKSALVEHFLDGLVDGRRATVLRGRAYEREAVPYKAVDAVIDALSRYLIHLSDSEGAPPLPPGTDALARLFPVLKSVPAVGALPEPPAGDPSRTRRQAFHALRDLVSTLAARRPFVIVVDDIQWGDTDSAGLLLELVQAPRPTPLLLVMAHREENAGKAPLVLEMKGRWPRGVERREVSVGPLGPDDAKRLSLAILGSDGAASKAIAEAVAAESEGNPFLVEELTRGAFERDGAAQGQRVTLEQMLGNRLRKLPDDARRMAEIVAVAGRPLPLATVSEAADVGSPEEVAALLSMQHFVRSGLSEGREVVEPMHDRVRETIVAMLSASVLGGHHARLARVLERTADADPEALAMHFLGAGETVRAAAFARKAAEQAVSVLAFDQAARLLRLSIDTMGANAETGPLYARLGEVLGWAGRNEDAARAYIAAAERVVGAERAGYERTAAAQLLAAGRIEEGGLMLRRVLAGVGVAPPASPTTTVLSLLAYKAYLRVFGLKFVERAPSEVPAAHTARIDALHVVALGLASVDNVLSVTMQARQFVEALRVGDRARIVRAATLYYGSHLATRGGPITAHERDVHALIERLVEKGGSPLEAAFSRGTHGCGLFVRGRWRQAVEVLDGAYARVPGKLPGMQAQAELYAVYAQAFLGDLVELRRRQARLLADAEERGDLFMTVLLRVSHPIVLLLADDDPDAARCQVREAKARWSHGKFLVQDWQVMRSEAEIELYAGNGLAAWERLARDARALEQSRLHAIQFMRALTHFALARAAIASLPSAPERRDELLSAARKAVRRLRRERMAWVDLLAALAQASIEMAEGDRKGAAASLRDAVRVAETTDMALYGAAARLQLGRCLGNAAGADLIAAAEATMRDQGIQAPARFASMLVPGASADDAPRRTSG